ncbi:MAG: dephospho-CoA kinase, partial [Deltaproteobacteria bacterium]
MRVIGLTGGIATGKSTVASLLAERYGLPVVDADQVAREIVAPGEPALAAIAERFGDGVLQADGTLDRAVLRERIMANADDRAALNAITHPAIFVRMRERLAELEAAGHADAVVEAALMVETGSYRMYPVLLVVSCDPETQVQRVMVRDGVDEAQARQTLAAQLPLAEKEAVATHVIKNDNGRDALIAAVDEA